MTKETKFILDDLEIELGVTLEQVAEHLPSVLIRDGLAIVPANLSPVLSGALARCALGVELVEFDGFALGKLPRYRPYSN